MINYCKGENEQEKFNREDIPIENLPDGFLWMQIKGGTKQHNVVSHATNALKNGIHRQVVWSGFGSGGVGKSITCAEILKRNMPNMHQVTRLCYQRINEFWEPNDPGLDRIVASRQIPCIHILQSLDAIPDDTPGHQVGQTEFWKQNEEKNSQKPSTKNRATVRPADLSD